MITLDEGRQVSYDIFWRWILKMGTNELLFKKKKGSHNIAKHLMVTKRERRWAKEMRRWR